MQLADPLAPKGDISSNESSAIVISLKEENLDEFKDDIGRGDTAESPTAMQLSDLMNKIPESEHKIPEGEHI
jgi:hypothetical protein